MNVFDLEEFKERLRIHGFWKAVYYTLHGLRVCKFVRQVIFFAQKLYAYLPIIWHDEDFDFSYLLTLMEFKLNRMSKHILEHDIIKDAPKVARELKVAATLCKRIHEDNYHEIPYNRLEEEYGKSEWRDGEKTEHTVELIIDHPKARKGTPEHEIVNAKLRKIFAHARTQRENDKQYLFNLMDKKIDTWWD